MIINNLINNKQFVLCIMNKPKYVSLCTGGQLCERPCSATPAPATSPTSQPTTASTVGTTASPTISSNHCNF